MTFQLVLFMVGLTALTLGADWLVTGASRVARELGMSPLIVGLTVVAFGTSAPELVVSSTAAIRGDDAIAVGNVLGSTIANVGLIVGLGAIMRPLTVHRRIIKRESPLLVLVLVIVIALSYNGIIGRLDGLVLVTGFSMYLASLIRWGSREVNRLPMDGRASLTDSEAQREKNQQVLDWLRVILGIVLLTAGAKWLVDAAELIARDYNISEAVIGATMVAVGTSIPELASTIAAAFRGLGDIAVGNVIGSNIFNLGLVLGTAALLHPLRLEPSTVVMLVIPALVFSLALIPLAYTGGRVSRFEGLLLLIGYFGFLWWII